MIGRDTTTRRRWIIGAMVLNGVLAVVLGSTITLSKSKLSATYEAGFPSDMLVIRNTSARPLKNVLLELDGRYIHRTSSLAPGVVAFEVQRSFEDERDLRPASGYVPERLRVVHASGVEELPIEAGREGS